MKKMFLLLVALVWVSKDFMFLDDAVKFLNTLSQERSVEAQVIAINSQRSSWSFGTAAYSVIYREETK